MKVVITGAAGQIAYSLIFQVSKGGMLGATTPVDLCLLDIPPAEEALKGVVMEIEDCAFPLVNSVTATTDYKTAFSGADIALLVGARPRGPGMERADLLKANAQIFQGQGKAIDQYASKDIKVVVVGNPANTNAAILAANAPSIPKENITALTRLDHNRAKAQIAKRVGVPTADVKGVIIWGNHSSTQYPDVHHGFVGTKEKTILKAVNDDAWLQGDFIKTVQKRGAAVIAARKLSSAASAAKAIVDHIRDWLLGTPENEYVSMAVPSDGSYGIAPGVVYSFPVTCSNGTYKIVQGLEVNAFSRKLMDVTDEELRSEFKTAMDFLKNGA